MPITVQQYQEVFDHIIKLEKERQQIALKQFVYPKEFRETYPLIVAEIQKHLDHFDQDIRQATSLALNYCLSEKLDTENLLTLPAYHNFVPPPWDPHNHNGIKLDDGIKMFKGAFKAVREALRNHETTLNLTKCNLLDDDTWYVPENMVKTIIKANFNTIILEYTDLHHNTLIQILRMPSLKKIVVTSDEWIDWTLVGGGSFDVSELRSLIAELQNSNLEDVSFKGMKFFAKSISDVGLEHTGMVVQFICTLISAPKLTKLKLTGSCFDALSPEHWQMVCDAFQHSNLRVLIVHDFLARLPNNGWNSFCEALAESQISTLSFKAYPKKTGGASHALNLDTLTACFEDNVTLCEVNVETPIPPGLKVILERNSAIRAAILAAEAIIANPYTPEIEEKYTETTSKISLALNKINAIQHSNTSSKLVELEEMLPNIFLMKKATYHCQIGEDDTALSCWLEVSKSSKYFEDARIRAFQLKYTSEYTAEQQRARAFLEALPCCLDDDNNLISFTNVDNNNLFNSFLFAAAGGVMPEVASLEADEQLALLQYIVLRDSVVKNANPAPPNTFFAPKSMSFLQRKIAALEDIQIQEIKKYIPFLQELWLEFTNSIVEPLNVGGLNENQKRARTDDADENKWKTITAISQLSASLSNTSSRKQSLNQQVVCPY